MRALTSVWPADRVAVRIGPAVAGVGRALPLKKSRRAAHFRFCGVAAKRNPIRRRDRGCHVAAQRDSTGEVVRELPQGIQLIPAIQSGTAAELDHDGHAPCEVAEAHRNAVQVGQRLVFRYPAAMDEEPPHRLAFFI